MSMVELFSNSKKQGHTDQSKQENVEDQKKLCAGDSSSSNKNVDVFTEGLDSSGPRNSGNMSK